MELTENGGLFESDGGEGVKGGWGNRGSTVAWMMILYVAS